MEARRPDAVLLLGGAVAVLEFKGKAAPSDADIDQAHAYARDLRCYHAACDGRAVHPVLVATRAAAGQRDETRGVRVRGPRALGADLAAMADDQPPMTLGAFLDPNAYQPLPTLVATPRELFLRHDIRRVHRAAAATDGAGSGGAALRGCACS